MRGEDSFVRAQLAGRPFLWHIYPQADNAHLDKLNAFLDLYTTDLTAELAHIVRAIFLAWNTPVTAAHLAAHGVAIIDEGQRFGAEGNGTSLYLQDPEGNTVELKGPPD